MRTFQSSARCPRCGAVMRTSNAKTHEFRCGNCKGRFQSDSVSRTASDFFEISVSARAYEYELWNEKLLELTDEYKSDFLGYDDTCSLIDIGWENGYPTHKEMHTFLQELNKIIEK